MATDWRYNTYDLILSLEEKRNIASDYKVFAEDILEKHDLDRAHYANNANLRKNRYGRNGIIRKDQIVDAITQDVFNPDKN